MDVNLLGILDELEDDVQSMREEGETDLRTVLHFISSAKHRLRAEIKNSVVISKDEYESLVEDADFLGCLEAVGVDNWSGYDYAVEMFEEDE